MQSGRFGACLMAEPDLVAACVAAMRAATDLPVTVKTRIGIDERVLPGTGGFRAPGRGGRVHGLHRSRPQSLAERLEPEGKPGNSAVCVMRSYIDSSGFPELTIVLNGGLTTLEQVTEQLRQVDGVMIGRAAYENPYLLTEVDRWFFGSSASPPNRHQVVRALLPYLENDYGREHRCNA